MPVLCLTCSSEIADGAQLCAHCGAAATVQTPPPYPPAQVPYLPTFATSNEINGIGGWLILPAIGLVASPFVYLQRLIAVDGPIVFGERYQRYLEGHRGLFGMVMFETLTHTILLVAAVYLAYLFFTKKRLLPGAMVTYLAGQAVFVLADHFAVYALMRSAFKPADLTAILRVIAGAAIWIPYFLVSERVKATFTR